jgi:hypothetical protein
VWAAANESYAAILEVRKLRAQVRNTNADLDRKLAALEGSGGGRGRGASQDGESLSRLNGELIQILGILEDSDQPPTVQAAATVTELRKALDAELAKWKELKP